MKNKYKIISLSVSGLLILILAAVFYFSRSGNINCTGALAMNSPGNKEYLFKGTITVKINPGNGSMINIFGNSISNLLPAPDNTHLVNRDITFNVIKRQKNVYYINNIKTIIHPEDNLNDIESAGLLFDMFDFENNRITVRRYLNSFIFGDVPLPSFICVKKK